MKCRESIIWSKQLSDCCVFTDRFVFRILFPQISLPERVRAIVLAIVGGIYFVMFVFHCIVLLVRTVRETTTFHKRRSKNKPVCGNVASKIHDSLQLRVIDSCQNTCHLTPHRYFKFLENGKGIFRDYMLVCYKVQHNTILHSSRSPLAGRWILKINRSVKTLHHKQIMRVAYSNVG